MLIQLPPGCRSLKGVPTGQMQDAGKSLSNTLELQCFPLGTGAQQRLIPWTQCHANELAILTHNTRKEIEYTAAAGPTGRKRVLALALAGARARTGAGKGHWQRALAGPSALLWGHSSDAP